MTRMAGNVKGISSFLNLKPGYGDIGGQGIQDSAQEIATIMQGNSMAANAVLNAQQQLQSAKHIGAARESMAQSQANAAIFGGAMSALGSIGSAGISKYSEHLANKKKFQNAFNPSSASEPKAFGISIS